MSRIQQLYEAMILEHNKNPRHYKTVDGHTHYSHGLNPLCGDDYEVFIKVEDNTIADIGFTGMGCAISKSSGSLMTDSIKGLSLEDALAKKDLFLDLVTTGLDKDKKEPLGKLKVFEGVQKFPVRVKCAALVWRALEDALKKQTEGVITTE